MTNSTISMSLAKDIINYTIDNNLRLQENGDRPISIGIEASAGIGKTSIVESIAKERGMNYVSLNLSELEEAGDLIGFPIKEYEVQVAKKVKDKDGNIKVQVFPNTVWVNEKQLDQAPGGVIYRQTGKTRMGYAKPSWVPEYSENGTVVNLDDFSRANQQLLQATMRLIDRQEYTSWSLPKKTTLILTSNSDNGEYNVSSLDEAQKTRFMNYTVTWDENLWCLWAEEAKIDGRCINFIMSYSKELFSADGEGNRICNPRSFTMFARMIAGISDWDNANNLNFISQIAKGCFKDEGDRFSKMFTAFIRSKMHLLVQPKDMLLGDWGRIKGILEKSLYDDLNDVASYRPDIASILERRFSNYVCAWLDSDDKTPIAKVTDRIIDFVDNESNGGVRLFNKDLFYHMVKTITSSHKNQTNKLLFEPKIARMIA